MPTVTVPGGQVTLRDPAALTVAQRRPIRRLLMQIGEARFAEIQAGVDTDGADVALTEREAALLDEMQEQTTLALLDSWTLPDPIPTTPDELGAMPGPLYDAISVEVAKLNADAAAAAAFDVDSGLDNQDSPTGASAA